MRISIIFLYFLEEEYQISEPLWKDVTGLNYTLINQQKLYFNIPDIYKEYEDFHDQNH